MASVSRQGCASDLLVSPRCPALLPLPSLERRRHLPPPCPQTLLSLFRRHRQPPGFSPQGARSTSPDFQASGIHLSPHARCLPKGFGFPPLLALCVQSLTQCFSLARGGSHAFACLLTGSCLVCAAESQSSPFTLLSQTLPTRPVSTEYVPSVNFQMTSNGPDDSFSTFLARWRMVQPAVPCRFCLKA